jgi:serine/threonine-protein kinase
MSEDPRVLQLLEEAMQSGRTPEDVCADAPELLATVRARLAKCRRLDLYIQDLLPTGTRSTRGPEGSERDPGDADPVLPTIPGYEVEAVLGRGGMGVVYRARDLRLKRPVALKMLLSGTYAARVERARFMREARAIAALRHPNVVQVYDVGEHEGRSYFTMELMDGGSLALRLGGVPLPAREAAALVATVAEAVGAAHRAGIIHRDLKPGNVLLAADGAPKVADFGLALQADPDGEEWALTQSGARVGTPSYMAPEQAAGQHRGAVGPPADVYALGAILYEALAGRPPFRGESAAQTEWQVVHEEPVAPSKLNARVPRDLETICLKCLRKDAGRRYASASALADDLGRFDRGEPVEARPVGRVERARKWARRRPSAAALWVGGVLVALVAAGGVLWFLAARAADARVIAKDLDDVAAYQKAAQWPEGNAALRRATDRLGARRLGDLQARLARARRDSGLVPRLEALGASAYYTLNQRNAEGADVGFAAAFQEAGIIDGDVAPAVAVERIEASNIRPALVAALYAWTMCTLDRSVRGQWLRQVLRAADGVPPVWFDRAFRAGALPDQAAVDAAASDPSLSQQPPILLLNVAARARQAGLDARPLLKPLQRSHPDDFRVNLLYALECRRRGEAAEAIRFAQAAVAVGPRVAEAYWFLGDALQAAGRADDALDAFHKAAGLEPDSRRYQRAVGFSLVALGRYEEAARVLRACIDDTPEGSVARAYLARCLEKMGRPDDAIKEYQDIVGLGPPAPGSNPDDLQNFLNIRTRLRQALAERGRYDELLAMWRQQLGAPAVPGEKVWSGYAECCLFRGRADEYRRACRMLLDRFEQSTDPRQCEYAGRTCLLAPPPEEDLRRAAALIDRALAADAAHPTGFSRYFRAAKALSEYRAGRPEAAIEIMSGDAGEVLGPLPQLVTAMAYARLGRAADARRALARAAVACDWRPVRANQGEWWMYHILRREAEAIVLPTLPALLEGRAQPADNAERLAMTPECEFRGRSALHALLWEDAFAADRSLEANGGRSRAVPPAVLAGCGVGADAASLPEPDRARWRAKARDRIRAELDVAAAPRADTGGRQQQARATLKSWSDRPDFAPVRDPEALRQLPAAERQQWTDLWQRVARLPRADGQSR